MRESEPETFTYMTIVLLTMFLVVGYGLTELHEARQAKEECTFVEAPLVWEAE